MAGVKGFCKTIKIKIKFLKNQKTNDSSLLGDTFLPSCLLIECNGWIVLLSICLSNFLLSSSTDLL